MWEDNIKRDLRECGIDSSGSREHGYEPSASITGGEFLD
jgi:hypothetical protein